MMEKDFIVLKGKSHLLCQDYARCGEDFIFLADGCSGSPDTDWGSRLLLLAAEQLLSRGIPPGPSFPCKVIEKAVEKARFLELSPRALDATFLGVCREGDRLHLFAAGDGLILMGDREGIKGSVRIEYAENLPFYLNYLTDPLRLNQYRFLAAEPVVRSRGLLTEWSQGEGGFYRELDIYPGLWVALFSDGVLTFSEEGSACETEVFLKELTAFKNTRGSFVQRRVKGFFRNRRGISHDDDFSMAALVIVS